MSAAECPPRAQIVSLGAGYDTNFFIAATRTANGRKRNDQEMGSDFVDCVYVELDLETVTKRKAAIISNSASLMDLIKTAGKSQTSVVVDVDAGVVVSNK